MLKRIFLPILLTGLVFSANAMQERQGYVDKISNRKTLSVDYLPENNFIVAALSEFELRDGCNYYTAVGKLESGCFYSSRTKIWHSEDTFYEEYEQPSPPVVKYLKVKISAFEATLQKDK